MPLFAVLFEDDLALADKARRLRMEDHLVFLERNAEQVRAAGPLRDATDGAPAGGCGLSRPATARRPRP